jgi:hypothetical protein
MQQEMKATQPEMQRSATAGFQVGPVVKFVAPVVVLLIVVGYVVFRLYSNGAGSGVTPRNEAIEQRWGIRVTQVGVTADGGMLDFRYLVINPDQALNLLVDESQVPTLVDEASGTPISDIVPMAHRHDMSAGVTYFMLYYNPNGLIKRGSRVSVIVGGLKLEHLVAQ